MEIGMNRQPHVGLWDPLCRAWLVEGTVAAALSFAHGKPGGKHSGGGGGELAHAGGAVQGHGAGGELRGSERRVALAGGGGASPDRRSSGSARGDFLRERAGRRTGGIPAR